MSVAAVVFLLATLIGLAYQISAFWLSMRFCQRRPGSLPNFIQPPVSLFKPIKGREPALLGNLRIFCQQDYATCEVLLGLSEASDPARDDLEQLCREYPHGRLVIANSTVGYNGKVNILCALAQQAKHDLWIVSDGDMRVDSSYTASIASDFVDSQVGMVTCLYQSTEGNGWGAALEALTIDLDFFPSVVVASHLEGLSYGFGATMAVRREAVEAIGGFSVLANYLADDYQLGYRISRVGYRVVLSPYIVESINTIRSFQEYFQHQLRWARTYRICRPGGYFGSFLTHALTLSVFFMLLCPHLLPGMPLVVLVIFVRVLGSAILLQSGLKSALRLRWLLLLPIKDLLASWIWLAAFLGNTVMWKTNKFRVQKDGTMVKIA